MVAQRKLSIKFIVLLVLYLQFMGIVEEVGDEVKTINRGDRVLVAFDISCGACFFCQHGYQSSCDRTNPSKVG